MRGCNLRPEMSAASVAIGRRGEAGAPTPEFVCMMRGKGTGRGSGTGYVAPRHFTSRYGLRA